MKQIIVFSSSCGDDVGGIIIISSSSISSSSNVFIIGPTCGSVVHFFFILSNYQGVHQRIIEGYRLGATYCRQVVKRGGVCVFVQSNFKLHKY